MFASLLLTIVFRILTGQIHLVKNNVVAINVLQLLYRILILGLPLLLVTIVKNNENYILSVANKNESSYGWKDYFLIRKISFFQCVGSIVISCFTLVLCYLVKSSMFNLYYGITGKVVIAGENLLAKTAMEMNVNSAVIAAISLILVPAVLEEALFRGCIYNSLQGHDLLFIVFSTSTFALLHQNITQLPFVLTIGMVCSLVMVYTQNTSLTIIIHTVLNTCVVFVLDRISLPLDLNKTIMHEDHTLALYYALIGFGIGIFCILCITVLTSVLFKNNRNKEKNKDDSRNIKGKEKVCYLLLMGLFLAVFIMEVM